MKNTVLCKMAVAILTACGATTATHADVNYTDLEPLKLTVPEMKPGLDLSLPPAELPVLTADPLPASSYKMTWMRTNPGVKPFKVMDDLTFVGIPVFAAGWIIKGDKASFRQDYNNKNSNTRLITNFKTGIDDYTQYFGPALTVGLKLAGYEGRSDWGRLLGTAAMSYGIMAGFVNGIKYTASEMRPDGSTANSWPSGHTATSFVGATILHKEYGLTRSPWFSVAGYGVATATGVMRILNNRHWISDVLSGAGIGIMSTELGYALGDLLFKKRGLLRNNLENNNEAPSFFAISMGVGFGLKDINFGFDDLRNKEDYDLTDPDEELSIDNSAYDVSVDFHSATSVEAEGAYFFNKYVGVGGRLRVRAMTAKSWSDFIGKAQEDRVEYIESIRTLYNALSPSEISSEAMDRYMDGIVSNEEITIESDHLTEFSANLGVYFNLPLNKHFSLGTKVMLGRTMSQELDINAHYGGTVKAMDTYLEVTNGELTGLSLSNIRDNGKYDIEWNYLTLGGNNSTSYGTGLSLTYKYKSNFSWRLFADYDYSRKTFTLTYDPMRFIKVTVPDLCLLIETMGSNIDPVIYEKKMDTNYFTIGGSFAVSF